MLVVEADLTPVASTYRDGDVDYFMDKITISFNGIMGIEEWNDYKQAYGDAIYNEIGFKSGNDVIGNVTNYSGENAMIESPYGNIATSNVFGQYPNGAVV